MSTNLILTGAYGRVYKTKEDAIKDWMDRKDFKIVNGPYCSMRDSARMLRLHERVYIRLVDGTLIQMG